VDEARGQFMPTQQQFLRQQSLKRQRDTMFASLSVLLMALL
jgi:hypothetical protein